MRALVSTKIGGPDTLVMADLPDPVPKDDEVLIGTKACGVNFPDGLIIEDKYQFRPPRPFSPGGEVAGLVESVGKSVSRFRPGDRVIGWNIWGGMAEKVATKAVNCVPIPEQMPFDEASALILTYGTSYYALKNRANLSPGETLIVLGAAGGVGLAAVELGKAMNARIIAAASSEEKVAFAKKYGADDGVVYPRGPFDKQGLRELAALFSKRVGWSQRHLRCGRRRLRGGRSSLHSQGRALPRGGVSGGNSKTSSQSRAAEVVSNRRCLLGGLGRNLSDRVRSERSRAVGAILTKRHQAGDLTPVSARGRRQGN
jgi:NADPH-dependent curcumin reductase CurA